MQIEKRYLSNGTFYYSFIRFDRERNKKVRLTRSYIQKRFGKDIANELEAERAAKMLDATHEVSRQKAIERLEWEGEFFEFADLVKAYRSRQARKAPNSFKNNVHYLRTYVMHYFLTVIKKNNVELWPLSYNSFRDWLENEATLLQRPGKPLAYGSKNHCIKALNTFMRYLYEEKIISALHLCESFPTHLLNEKSVDDVISFEDMERIYETLAQKGYRLEAVFFRCLYFTGMRFNEALGISMGDVFSAEIQAGSMKSLLENYQISSFGYLVLTSQPHHETRGLRNKEGRIDRKPLKGRMKISEKYSRIIPITDLALWKDLIGLFNAQVDFFENKRFGDNPLDYALFDALDKTTATRRLKTAYSTLKIPYRSWHCCRHSCATNIIGDTRDFNLARLWLGHRSERVIEKYVHVHQAIVRASTQVSERGRFKKILL